jgi:drug/metabolite transporter (DMT)-like permease
MPQLRNQLPALIALGCTALLWASAFPATKAALKGYAAADVVLLRLAVAGLCFGPVLLPSGRARLANWRNLWRIAGLGLLGVFGYQTLLVLGQSSITASAAGFVITAVPIFTALLSAAAIGERLRPLGWVGLAVGGGGVSVITAGEGLDLGSVTGIALVVTAALATAVYFVLQKPVLREEPPVRFLAWAIWLSVPAAMWTAPGLPARIAAAPLEATLAAVYLGVFPMALGYGCYTFALARLPASLASSSIYLQPPISALIAWVWLGERPDALIWVGGAAALVGVALVTRFGAPRQPRIRRGSPAG